MVRVTLQQRSDAIAKKLSGGYRLPLADVLMNGGCRRTEEKRALLQYIQDMADQQGRGVPFAAKF